MKQIFKRAGISLLLITLVIGNVLTLIPPASYSSGSSSKIERTTNSEADLALLPGVASDPVLIPVILSFGRSVQAEDLAIFKDLGGVITHGPWSSAIQGFAGTIFDSQLLTLQATLPDAIVERDQAVTTSLNSVSRLARARNYTWDTLGLNGTSNSTIAILDTGINAAHPAFNPGYESFNWDKTVISWNDTISGIADPYDDNAHGSIIASVIASRGFTTESETGAMVANFTANLTHQGLFGGSGVMAGSYQYKLLSVNVTEANTTITANAKYFEFSIGQVLEFDFEWHDSSQATVASVAASLPGAPYQISHNVTTHTGVYDLYIHYHVPEASTFIFSVDAAASWHCALQTDAYLNSTGVAPGSKLAVAKVLDSNGAGSFASVIDGLNWVVDNKTASHIVAVCLSMESSDLVTPESLAALNATLDQVIAEGILVVVAAGNKGVVPSALNRIALNPKVLVVGATNENDQVTYYSSQGETVGGQIKPDLVAPGGSLLPAHLPVFGASNWSNQLISMEGTSISAAVVAGAVNILIQAMGSYELNWTYSNSQSALDIKSRLLMTATETNLQREDDPTTPADESLSSPTLSRGGKDIQEGYGRLNIDAAAESYLLTHTPTVEERGNLTSSITSPQGKHAWARRVVLAENQPYQLSLTVPITADFDLYLYQNYSDEFGEPRLISKSTTGANGVREQIYFTPSNVTREYILVVKAVAGAGEFAFNITLLDNYNPPQIQAIWSVSDDPGTNNTWSTYTVYVNYTDADNNSPVSVILSISNGTMGFGYSQNYTMTAQTPGNQNFTINATYYRNFGVDLPGHYHIYARVFDGIYYDVSTVLGLNVATIHATPFPYKNDFYYNYPGRDPAHWIATDAVSNWTYSPVLGDGWNFLYYPSPQVILGEYYIPDYASLSYKPYWFISKFVYGETPKWDYSEYLDTSLQTPYIFLQGAVNPVVRVGIRVSLALGDFFYVEIQENNSAWTILQLYTASEIDWTQLVFDLSEYKDSYVRLRFRVTTDGVEDSLRNKGVILDSVSFEEESSNVQVPELSDPSVGPFFRHYVEPQQGSRFQKYRFNVIYTDEHMPTFVYLEMSGINHTMYNNQKDVWTVRNRWDPSGGILYSANITVTDYINRQYRFHASDGVNIISTNWFSDGPIVQGNPQSIGFPFQENFTSSGYDSWFIAGTPDKMETHEWLKTNTSWDIVYDPFGTPEYFWYCGVQTVITAQRYYGPNWDAWLVSKPIQVNSPQDVHLYFTHMLNFDFPWGEDQAFVDISTDYGRTFTNLMTFGGFNYTGTAYQDIDIDISKYNHSNITIRFRFVSDNVPAENPMFGLNMGWRVSHIEINASVEIVAPNIVLQHPDLNSELTGTVQLNFTISDNTQVDVGHTELYINGELVTPTIWVDPQTQVVYLSYTWDTKETENGIIRIRIVALDMLGNTADLTYNSYVNNPFDWMALLMWAVLIAVITAFAAIAYKTNFFMTFKDRTKAAKKMQAQSTATKSAKNLGIPIISDDMVNETVEEQEEFTLFCKKCKKEFHSKKFEWMCPSCDTDSLFLKTYCIYCGVPALLEDPRKTYCKKCGSRLLRQPNKILNQLRVAMGVNVDGTAPAAAKKHQYPIVTDSMVNEEEEAKVIFTLKCKKCGTSYESDHFLWTCPKCQGDSLYMRSKCLHCDKELLLDSPRKNYCDKCKSRLLRQPELWASQHFDLDFKKGEKNA